MPEIFPSLSRRVWFSLRKSSPPLWSCYSVLSFIWPQSSLRGWKHVIIFLILRGKNLHLLRFPGLKVQPAVITAVKRRCVFQQTGPWTLDEYANVARLGTFTAVGRHQEGKPVFQTSAWITAEACRRLPPGYAWTEHRERSIKRARRRRTKFNISQERAR